MTTFSVDNLRKIFPATKAETLKPYVEALNLTCEKFDISTTARKAAFIAQVGHESGGFVHIRENLNYSAQGLIGTFGKYFNAERAARYARQPELIASRVYASRMGNGDEASKDGWKFRGRGCIQITGRNNYTALAKFLGKTLEETCAYLETHEGAVMSAGWFWSTNDLNEYADATRFTDMTKRINGGTNGLADRKEIWHRAKAAL